MIDDNEILLPELLKFLSTQKSCNLIKKCARYGCPPQNHWGSRVLKAAGGIAFQAQELSAGSCG